MLIGTSSFLCCRRGTNLYCILLKNACDLHTIEAIMVLKNGYFSEILATCAASALIM